MNKEDHKLYMRQYRKTNFAREAARGAVGSKKRKEQMKLLIDAALKAEVIRERKAFEDSDDA
jgi:hypothetical protein